jgi:hypothetical protein
MDRRHFLTTGLAGLAALAARRAAAFGTSAQFGVGRIRYAGGEWDPRPHGLDKLLLEIEKRTSIITDPTCPAVSPADVELFETPFSILAGDRGFDPLSNEARQNLSHYLRAGGTLLIDASEGNEDGEFYRAVRRELSEILPSSPMTRISAEHVLYKSFYLIDQPPGRDIVAPYMEACEQDGRLLAIYSHNDLLGAWARDSFGNWLYEVHPGGERQREMSFRMGINIAMYVLCQDYKQDQVHVPFILHRRQWRIE